MSCHHRMWVLGLPAVLLTGAVAAFSGCSCDSEATDTEGTGANGTGANGTGANGTGASAAAGGAAGWGVGGGVAGWGIGGGSYGMCAGIIYECGDLLDNDDDGLVDWQDPACTGPCDNTEDSLYPDLPGMTGDKCRLDCFWDNGNGPGNDDCHWDHQCDPLEVDPGYHPEVDCPYDDSVSVGQMTCAEAFETQSDTCYAYCVPLVPNGCDCFGCCELPPESGKFVWLQSYDEDKNGTCNLDVIEDPTMCHPCTPVPGCSNGCGRCELCMGKTEVPEDCFGTGGTGAGGTGAGGGPPEVQCDPDVQPCGLEGQDPCPTGYYCITGCCIKAPT